MEDDKMKTQRTTMSHCARLSPATRPHTDKRRVLVSLATHRKSLTPQVPRWHMPHQIYHTLRRAPPRHLPERHAKHGPWIWW